ncbi:5-deoxyglucuronate isomerase [Sphingomonas sp. PP-F2F-A104-K0414]|uniref:5-deoxy-glucuronate isomerase n=1 Tax=Sphingomonas sp. PP-F2F-A104-K0414 TaxID=2135661 RepID=UPI00104C05E2|nr:5-deoxy-glucuronate isomerase [Sphingomonas sp. PP-F2F-A104-K0414]TCP96747.1 5-deoxyglucuronate isomerase [Sphingomonas sp. PP-F2F-A104-K0414]
MSRLRIASSIPADDGVVVSVTPSSAGWTHVGFSVVRLAAGQRYRGGDPTRELCVVILSGTVDIVAGDRCFTTLGSRRTVFDGPPVAMYLPAGCDYTITASTVAEIALCTAPGTTQRSVRVIPPDAMPCEVRGSGTNTRFVRNILPEGAEADSLLVVEVVTPGGHWSSYPPHKHDSDSFPEETQLEETYYHRLSPREGFAIQRVYTDDRSLDETIAVNDGDVVLVPLGYHPVSASPGHDLYYLNVMAGPRRSWRVRTDPDYVWLDLSAPPPI